MADYMNAHTCRWVSYCQKPLKVLFSNNKCGKSICLCFRLRVHSPSTDKDMWQCINASCICCCPGATHNSLHPLTLMTTTHSCARQDGSTSNHTSTTHLTWGCKLNLKGGMSRRQSLHMGWACTGLLDLCLFCLKRSSTTSLNVHTQGGS